MEYPKIQTLYKRDMVNRGKIIEGEYSRPEFENIKKWSVTEKIDGTNIRIIFRRTLMGYMREQEGEKEQEDSYSLEFRGRTDNAQIPAPLVNYLKDTFTIEKMRKQFPNATEVILFGEGYGPKIQKGGGRYRDDQSFILFDVWIDGWWLDRLKVEDIGQQLGINYVTSTEGNSFGELTIEEIVACVKGKMTSHYAKDPTLIAEGVVCRPVPLMLYRDGTPIMFKLKCRDFE